MDKKRKRNGVSHSVGDVEATDGPLTPLCISTRSRLPFVVRAVRTG